MNPDISQLAKDVAELKAWKELKTRQQISYPLDSESKNILYRPYPRPSGLVIQPVGLLSGPFVSHEVDVNGHKYWIQSSAAY